ncbi:MAG: hypothetical protein MI919_28090 [Holophagales bacterium]|nr:hypothetical protein [Holophagales bacterium]
MSQPASALLGGILRHLDASDGELRLAYPGAHGGRPAPPRQPVHTVYGGAHLFHAEISRRLGRAALAHFQAYFPDFIALAEVLRLDGWEKLPHGGARRLARIAQLEQDVLTVSPEHRGVFLAATVYRRTLEKLDREPVEDYRIDFEDGYGPRPDAEEDSEALRVAEEMATGMERGSLPPFVGIRIKSLGVETRGRAVRTLELFLSRLVERTEGSLPEGFVITLPKVEHLDQVRVVVHLLQTLEDHLGLEPGCLRLELMVETPASLVGPDGRVALPELVSAAGGRCVGAHLGIYDLTASLGIIAAHQAMGHPACDLARQIMLLSLAGTGVAVVDGATSAIPVGPFRQSLGGPPLTEREEEQNRYVVHRVSWKNFCDVRHSLRLGIYQGWDLHPSQLPIRYAAVYSFFLENLKDMTLRLRQFVDRAAQATLMGEVFDDAATGQGLLAFVHRGLACGAITEDEATATGLTLEELAAGSFHRIMAERRRRYEQEMGR